jgi:diguanylate cyclase (GGDEF)-like protein/PAS domain S-box-containing protein
MAAKVKSVTKPEEKNNPQKDDLFHLAKDIIANAVVGIYIVQHGKFVYVSELYQKITGYSDKELIGLNSLNNIHHDDRATVRNQAIKCLKKESFEPYEYRFVRKDNAVIWVLETITPIVYKEERATLGSFMDITERKQMEKVLRQSEEKYRTILESIQEGYFEVDLSGNLTFFNDATCLLFGYAKEELLGMNDRQYTDKETSKNVFQTFNKVYKTGEPTKGLDWQIIRKDGTKRYIETSISLQKDSSDKPIGFRGIIRDITERKQIEHQLNHIATHDTLTGMPNRMLFMDRLKVALAQSKRNRNKLAVMMLDLDNFKNVNDTLGHMVGDQLLKEVGRRLSGLVRQSDTVARLGGDEFIILLSDIERMEDAVGIAETILKAFQQPFICGNHKLTSSTSIGIALYPDDCQDVDSLLKNSDKAMYSVKAQGRNNYKFFAHVNQSLPVPE